MTSKREFKEAGGQTGERLKRGAGSVSCATGRDALSQRNPIPELPVIVDN